MSVDIDLQRCGTYGSVSVPFEEELKAKHSGSDQWLPPVFDLRIKSGSSAKVSGEHRLDLARDNSSEGHKNGVADNRNGQRAGPSSISLAYLLR